MSAHHSLRKLLTNAGALVVGGIVAQAIYVCVEALIARRLGTHDYGIYSSSAVIVVIMAHLIDMGMYWKLVQDGSRDPGTLRTNLGTMMVARLGLFVLCYPVILAMLYFSGEEDAAVSFFALFAFFGVQVGVHELLGAVYTARQRQAVNAVFQTAVPICILAGVALLVVPDPTLTRLAVAFIVAAGCVTTVWVWVIWKREKPQVRLDQIGATLQGCLHYGISGLVWNVYLRIGVLVLTFVAGPEEVAFLAAAAKLIDLCFKVAVLANRVVAPRLYSESQHQPAEFVKTSELLLRMTVASSATGALLLYAAGSWIIALVYGEGFGASDPIIQILGLSLTLKTIALIAQTILSAAGDHASRTRIVVASTLVAIAVAIPFAAQWGAFGVAYAVVAGDVLLLALLMWRVWKTGSTQRVFQVFAVPVFGGMACAVLVEQLGLAVWMETLGSLAAFGVILWLSGYLAPIVAVLRPLVLRKRAGSSRGVQHTP